MANDIINIREYFSIGSFDIPNYQRGYKWGVPDNEGHCQVSLLMDNLIHAKRSKVHEYFMQGVTTYEVDENEKTVVLVDGQQRTTTFYLLLKYLNYDSLPQIHYAIREESNYVLNNCKIENGVLNYELLPQKDYNLQDIFYFIRAVSYI